MSEHDIPAWMKSYNKNIQPINDKLAREFAQQPHGWIQWKGTDVCIDIHCSCGHISHFDGDFMYYIECCNCGKKYLVSQYINLVELPDVAVFAADNHIPIKLSTNG